MIPVLLFVSVITFSLMKITPGGPWDREKSLAPQVVQSLNRKYNLAAPKGVNGRNSDNTLIKKVFEWEPDTRLRDGMEKTYRWIYDQMTSK